MDPLTAAKLRDIARHGADDDARAAAASALEYRRRLGQSADVAAPERPASYDEARVAARQLLANDTPQTRHWIASRGPAAVDHLARLLLSGSDVPETFGLR